MIRIKKNEPLAEVFSSHIVDSPGEALWLRIGDDELPCDHFEEEARKIADMINAATNKDNNRS